MTRITLILCIAGALMVSACASDPKPTDLTMAGNTVSAPVTPVTVAPVTASPAPAAATVSGTSGGVLYRIDVGLAKKAVPDLQAAIADATNHNDKLSLLCWNYGLPIAQAIAGGNLNPTSSLPGIPIGLFSGIQTARDIKAILKAGPTGLLPDDFYVNCGPLMTQEGLDQAALLARFGISIGTGGAAAAVGL